MPNKDYYSILGVSKTATDAEIKKAYRKLAQQFHPDRHKGDKDIEKKFKEINQAYETLSDNQKRSSYDQFGADYSKAGSGGQGFGGFGSGGFSAGFSGAEGFAGGFADIFETFFSGGQSGRSKKGPVPGDDIGVTMQLTFEEAAFGSEKEIELDRIHSCENCRGTGAAPGTNLRRCQNCNGQGQIRTTRNTILGHVQTVQACPACGGEGESPEKKCPECHGTTRIRKKDKMRITIPAGIEDGATLRLREKGNAGHKGGNAGDLYISIHVKPNPQFARRGANIFSTQKIHIPQAALGDIMQVDTIHGPVSLKIPPGTEHGKSFKIKEYGVQKLHGSGKGDHYLEIAIDIPQKLSKREKELYEALAKEQKLDIKEKGWFG